MNKRLMGGALLLKGVKLDYYRVICVPRGIGLTEEAKAYSNSLPKK